MSAKGPGRVSRIIGIIALVLGALLWIAQIYAEDAVRNQLREKIHTVGAVWVDQDSTDIDVNLFLGNASLGSLKLIALDSAMNSLRISGHFQLIEVNGLSYWKLLFSGNFFADKLQVVGNSICIEFPEDSTGQAEDPSSSILSSLGSLKLDINDLMLVSPAGIHSELGALYGTGKDLRFERSAGAAPSFKFENCDLVLLQAVIEPVADSSLNVEILEWDMRQGTLMVRGLSFGVRDVMAVAPTVGIERDVIAGDVEVMNFTGVDVQAILEGRFEADVLHLADAQIRVARDKVLGDPSFSFKPLPARLIREFPEGSGIDTVIVDELDVDYFERVDAARGFGHIPFRSIQGELLHLRNTSDAVLTLKATANIFEGTPVAMELSSAVHDTTDAVEVKAFIGELSFATLRKAIAPLTGVALPEGDLDTLIMYMSGRDRTADARIWMAYEELKVERKDKKKRLFDPVVDLFLNAAVKSERSNEEEGEGWTSYTVERRRDRSVFNYLWSGVREGAKESMVSETVKTLL